MAGSGFTITPGDAPLTILLSPAVAVSLSATPAPSGTFSYWSGSHPGVGTGLSFDMGSTDEAVTANFVAGTPFNLTLDKTGPGTVSVYVDSEKIYEGTNVVIPFTSGKVVNVEATADSGHFSYWTVNSAASPAGFLIFDATQNIIMSNDYYLTANFTTTGSEYTLDLDLGGAGSGSITAEAGGGTQSITSARTLYFSSGENVGLSASTVSDKFSYWSVSGPLPAGFNILEGTSQTITMSDNYDLTAMFAGTGYSTLNLSVVRNGTITVTIDGVSSAGITSYEGYFDNDVTVYLTAVKGATTEFSYWSAGTGSLPSGFDPLESAMQPVDMDDDYDLIANFTGNTKYLLTVELSDYAAGEVDISIGGNTVVTVTSTVSMFVTSNTVVTLTATAYAPDYLFSFWSGTTEGISAALPVTMSSAQNITAVFAETVSSTPPWELDVRAVGPGKVEAVIDGYPITLSDFVGSIPVTDGVTVELTAVPNTTDDIFLEWDGGPDTGTDDNPSVFDIDDDQTITAYFASSNDFMLTIDIVGAGEVYYSIDGGSPVLYTSTPVPVPSGMTVDLQAVPTGPNVFSFWSGDYEGVTTTGSFTMEKSYNITALFTGNTYYTLSLAIADGEGAIEVSVEIASVVYGFTYTSDMMPDAVNIDAGVDVTVTAVPGASNKFSYWSGTDKPVGFRIGLDENTFAMNDDYDLTAHFTGTDYRALTLDISGGGTIGLAVGGETHTIFESDLTYIGYFDYEAYVSLTAAVTTADEFSYWRVTGTTPSGFDITNASAQSIQMEDDYNLTAVFTSSPWHTLEIAATGNGDITVALGDGSLVIFSSGSRTLYLNEGTEVIITATATGTDVFSYWLVDGSTPASFDISKGTAQTVKMEDDYDLTAVFTTGTFFKLTLAAIGPAGTHIAGTSITVTPVPGVGSGSFSVGAAGYEGYFDIGTEIELEAVGTASNRFSYWSGDMPDINPLSAGQTFSMEDDYDMTANFTAGTPRKLTIGVDGDGEVEVKFGSTVVGVIYSDSETYVPNGTIVTLTATPGVGLFSFWSCDAGDSASEVLVLSMTADHTATAVFTDGINDHNITLAVNNTAWGSISTTVDTVSGNTYVISLYGTIAAPVIIPLSHGDTVSLSAVPVTLPAPHAFTFWVGDISTASHDPLEIEMDDDYEETAYFTDGVRDVELIIIFDDALGYVELTVPTLSASPVMVVSGEAIYLSSGLSITLEATATAAGNHFSYWSSFVASIENPWGFALNETNYTVNAYFTNGTDDKELTLGTVGAGKILLTIDSLMGPVGPIDLIEGHTWFNYDTEITVSPVATGAVNYFSYWAGTVPSGFVAGYPSAQTFNMRDNYDMTAIFTTGEGWTLTLTVDDIPGGDGMITVTLPEGGSFDVTTTYTGKYDDETPIQITVSAVSGIISEFSHWVTTLTTPAGVGGYEDVLTFIMSADYDLTAVFYDPAMAGDSFTLDLDVDGPGTIELSVGGFDSFPVTLPYTHTFAAGTPVEITAVPDTGMEFSHWEAASAAPAGVAGDSEQIAFDMDDDFDLTAFFYDPATAGDSFTLDLDADGPGTIELAVGGFDSVAITLPYTHTFAAGTPVEITAVPDTGMEFSHWEAASAAPAGVAGDAIQIAFDMDDDFDLTAFFYDPATAGDSFTLDLDVDGPGTIELAVGGFDSVAITLPYTHTFAAGTPVEITAVPDTGMEFSHWEAAGAAPAGVAGDSEQIAFDMDDDFDLTAFFYDPATAGDSFTLDLDADGPGTIELAVGGFDSVAITLPYTHTFAVGTEVEITAVPGGVTSNFSHWVSAGATAPTPFSSLSDTNVFDMNENYDLTAVFFTGTGNALDVAVTGDGTVNVEVGGFTIVVTDVLPFSHVFAPGTAVTLTAVPSLTPSYFSHWASAGAVTPAVMDPLSATNAFNMNNDYDLTAVFFTGAGNALDVSVTGDGTVNVEFGGFTIVTTDVSPFSHVFAPGTAVTLTAVPNAAAGWSFVNWEWTTAPATMDPLSIANAFNMGGDYDLTAVFLNEPPGSKQYVITATADTNSNITPSGVVTVESGTNQTFSFYADKDYVIYSVTVDGVPLSQAEIDSGHYTFRYVLMNHTIDVKSVYFPRTDITLRIDIMEGRGYAEYSVNGLPFVRYAGVVDLPDLADVIVIAYADGGYRFDRWETPSVDRSSEIAFYDLGGSLHLRLYFTSSESPADDNTLLLFVIGIILLLIIAGLLIWYLAFYRRQVDVIKVGYSSSIIGKDRVYRKRAYHFSIEGGYTGGVSYRVGEDGMWKLIFPNEKGEYVIPRGEIVESVTIEQR
ncbi:MAG: hypothetical protein FWG41_01375 [Methanomassiliicoccaceae archaeon]|nr:hypothetical protein [Methanomassiliicoccaceae archaeon]